MTDIYTKHPVYNKMTSKGLMCCHARRLDIVSLTGSRIFAASTSRRFYIVCTVLIYTRTRRRTFIVLYKSGSRRFGQKHVNRSSLTTRAKHRKIFSDRLPASSWFNIIRYVYNVTGNDKTSDDTHERRRTAHKFGILLFVDDVVVVGSAFRLHAQTDVWIAYRRDNDVARSKSTRVQTRFTVFVKIQHSESRTSRSSRQWPAVHVFHTTRV